MLLLMLLWLLLVMLLSLLLLPLLLMLLCFAEASQRFAYRPKWKRGVVQASLGAIVTANDHCYWKVQPGE